MPARREKGNSRDLMRTYRAQCGNKRSNKGEKTDYCIVIVAMLRLSRRHWITETYVHFSSFSIPLILVLHIDLRIGRLIPMQYNFIFKHKIQLQIKMQRIFVRYQLDYTHLYLTLPSALPSSHLHPHVNKDLAHHRSLNPSFVIKRESCAIIEVKNKMVAWYSDSFPWLQTAGTDWKVKIWHRPHGTQAPSCGQVEVPQLSRWQIHGCGWNENYKGENV